MKIIPQGDRVYARLLPIKEETYGEGEVKIIIADKHSKNSRIGEVLAVGGEVENFKEGDFILVSFYTGIVLDLLSEHMVDDTYRIFSSSEIIAKVED